MTDAPVVSVVVPVYRSRPELPELHRRLRLALGECGPTELIFVNDACPDGSLEVLNELAGADADVRVIALSQRQGQFEATCEGLAGARGGVVVVMDADLQDPPEAIPALIAALGGGFGVVYAARRGHYESLARLVESWVFKRLVWLITGMPPDAGAFYAMSRDVAARAAALRGTRPYLTAAVALIGRPVGAVPIVRSARTHGRSAYTPTMRASLAIRALLQAVRWRASGAVR